MLKDVLKKAFLGGIVPMVKLGTKGEFEVSDPNRNVLVIYKGEDKELFKEDVGIFNLSLLLDMLKMAEDPKITYKDGILVIKDGSKVFEYMTAEPSVIYTAYQPEKGSEHVLDKIKKLEGAVTVKLGRDTIKDILQGSSILKDAQYVTIEGKEKSITFIIGGANEHRFRVKVDVDTLLKEPVMVSKPVLQAVLSECEGDEIPVTLYPKKAPVVICEQDVKYIINQCE